MHGVGLELLDFREDEAVLADMELYWLYGVGAGCLFTTEYILHRTSPTSDTE